MPVLTVFRDLIAKYPTWDALSAWLESKEGGSLRVVKTQNAENSDADVGTGSRYVIVRYDKKSSDMKAAHVGAFRSVVWDTQANRPVAMAPPKAERGVPSEDVAVRVSDFVDGVMVNVWRGVDASGGGAAQQLATRTSLGAAGHFYSQKSFAQLFAEVAGAGDLSVGFADGEFASCVLQHPEHRTVHPITEPSLLVVMTGLVAADGTVTLQYAPSAWPEALRSRAPRVFSENKTFKRAAEALGEVQQQAYLEPAGWQGLVFQEMGGVGRRWRVRNSTYVMLRGLRGGEPTVKARFARLRAEKQVKAYLKYYTDETAAFWDCEQLLRRATGQLFELYGKLHKSKEVTWRDVAFALRGHLYALHGKYVNELREKKQTVTREIVVEYVNALPADQIFSLLREHNPPTEEQLAKADERRAARKAAADSFSGENPLRAATTDASA
jgi:hypothetical protein